MSRTITKCIIDQQQHDGADVTTADKIITLERQLFDTVRAFL